MDLQQLRASHAAVIAAEPEDLYTMVSDITRTGEWSPACTGGQWDEGAGPRPGAWFTGRNKAGTFEWTTRCQVTAASPGHDFSFVVGGAANGWVRWTYSFRPATGGTLVTESWEVLRIVPRMGETDDQLLSLRDRTQANLEATLQALKDAVEASDSRPSGPGSPTRS
jgi:Polyketide cyclase / dehydrase and lipid transport